MSKGRRAKRRWSFRFATLGSASLLVTALVYGEPSIYPTGVTLYEPAKAYNSYVAYSSPDGRTRLIDMDGDEVHVWPRKGFPAEVLPPQLALGGRSGDVLLQIRSFNGKVDSFQDKTIGEMNWKNKVVWEWGTQGPQGGAHQNQALERLQNGDTLFVATYTHAIPGISERPVDDQAIYEVNRAGRIVWRWVVGDHVKEFGISSKGLHLLRRVLANGFRGEGFLTINAASELGRNQWYDRGDRRFNPHNIMISSREASFIAIIDKKTGRVVWRIGPRYRTLWPMKTGGGLGAELSLEPVFSRKLPRPVDQLSGQHDAHMIPEGLPGAGDVLVLDDEGQSGFPTIRLSHHPGSRVLEIDPVTKEIVWEYDAEMSDQPSWDFYTAFIGSARRLPNGNTLICEGMTGRLFQVDPKGEIVWEYVNPHFGKSGPGQTTPSNWVYIAQPVPYDWMPRGTPHDERPVARLNPSNFHVPRG